MNVSPIILDLLKVRVAGWSVLCRSKYGAFARRMSDLAGSSLKSMAAHLHLVPALVETLPEPSLPSPIRVVLADDHALMRRSLRLLLEGEEGVEVIGEPCDLASAVRHVQRQNPDVLVLDLRIPDGFNIETIGELRQGAPNTQVVLLTMHDNPAFAQHALTSGALGFVLKELADDELPQAIRATARGEEYVSPRIAARLDALQRSLARDELTPREVQVLRLIALGHTSVEIAGKLIISPRTVESHRARIHDKLGLATRAELVHHALGRGLLRG
jgi:two-component system, NarL family, response regulator NreC